MPVEPGPVDSSKPTMPSGAWIALRDYMTGKAGTGRDWPDRRREILKHGRDLPETVASDLWRRRT